MTEFETSPVVIARVEPSSATIEIAGETHDIDADNEEEARHEVLRRTVQVAVDSNSDVRLVTTDVDGQWQLIVSPDGHISELAPPTRGAGSQHREAESRPFDDDIDGDDQGDVNAPPAAQDFSEGLSPATADTAQRAAVTVNAPIVAEPSAAAVAAPRAAAGASVLSPAWPFFENEDAITTPPPATITTPSQPAVASAPAGAPQPTVTGPPLATPQSPPQPVSASLQQAFFDNPTGSLTPQPQPLPTLADFQASQPTAAIGPAQQGWRGFLVRSTGGMISPQPGKAELRHRDAVAAVTRSLSGPRTICVINPKGGAHKTTATMLIASTFGIHRGGYTLAWDNNETRGTLGWRAHQARHTNTAVNLLNDLDRFTNPAAGRVGDLDNYVRSQAEAQFDVLASDEDAAASSMIDAEGFNRLHETLQRFYRIIVVDTGNNMRASNWEAAVDAADQLVIVTAIREDTAGGAAWMVEGLAKKGHEEKLRNAVTVLSAPAKTADPELKRRLYEHFGSLTRSVVEVPHDPSLVSGGAIIIDALAPATREAWLNVTATIADEL